MSHRFHLLPVGSRFRWEGAVFTKTNPLLATGNDGKSRMVPRSALVEPLDAAAAPPLEHRQLEADEVLAAVTACRDRYQAELGNMGDKQERQRLSAAFDAVWESLLERLGLDRGNR